MFRPVMGALAALALLAPVARADRAPDAEIFATNNTAVITDPDDPRLDDRLEGFAREVERIIADGGGRAEGSELLDGVFFDAGRDTTTFERSRVFDVERVEPDELHTIADTIRSRFGQSSVLTFDRLPAGSPDVDAVELEVPSVSAGDLRSGLLADAEARSRLFGGSVTQDHRLLLVAGLEDRELARTFAARIGGDLRRAVSRYGRREFVDGPLPARVEHRTLVVTGGPEVKTVALAARAGRVEVDAGADGSPELSVRRARFDDIRVDALDTLVVDGTPGRDDLEASAAGARARLDGFAAPITLGDVGTLRLLAAGGDDAVAVGDLSATGTFQVDADLGAGADRALVDGSEEDDQISFGAFGVLAPTYVRFLNPEAGDALTIDGRGGDDLISASTAAMRLTLAGGDGDNTLLGGPGDDRLLGGPGFDDARGGGGDDVAVLRGDFDRFSWRPGDGHDVVDGGASRDSLSFSGTNAPEAFDLRAEGRALRLGGAGAVLSLEGVEEIDALAGGGADTFAIGDLRRTDAQLVDVSLAAVPITAGGDGAADRVRVAGTDRADALALAGKVVVGGTATLTGLPWTVNVSHAEPADVLAVDGGLGADTLDASALAPGTIGLEFAD